MIETPDPAMVWPLADFLAEEMEARDWTCVDVAIRMPGDYGPNIWLINLLLACPEEQFKLGDGADALAQAFGVSPEFINGLYDVWVRNPQARQPFTCPEHLLEGIVSPEPTP